MAISIPLATMFVVKYQKHIFIAIIVIGLAHGFLTFLS